MPLNNYTIGRDISLNIIGPNGPLAFSQIIGFQSKPDTTDQKIKGLDGVTRHLRFPDGWSGTFELERQNSTLDDYWVQLEDNYYAGLNETPISVTETIREVNGSISQYRYVDVLLTIDDAGSYKGDKSVNQKIKFVSARRLKVA
jgi:hypothetical protein